MTNTDSINFKGKFKKYDPNGRLMKYSIGDTVEFDGDLYTATEIIIDVSPVVGDSGWKMLSSPSSFFVMDIPPSSITYNGDRWYVPSTGILYTRIRDENGKHWIEM